MTHISKKSSLAPRPLYRRPLAPAVPEKISRAAPRRVDRLGSPVPARREERSGAPPAGGLGNFNARQLEQLQRATAGASPEELKRAAGKIPKEDLEEWLYQRELQGMSDEELAAELGRQQERAQESSTGYAQDPVEAQDAQWRVEQVQQEQARRKIQDPTLPLGDYAAALPSLDDEALAAEERRVQAALEDAQGGPHTNAGDAEALQGRLAAIHSEQGQRVVDDPTATDREYRAALNALSDEALLAEQAEVSAEYQALLQKMEANPLLAPLCELRLSRLAVHLAALDAEVSTRGLEASEGAEAGALEQAGEAAVEAAAEVAQASEAQAEVPAVPSGAAAGTEEWPIQAGDTLSEIACTLSERNGGVPDPATVMADLVALNDLDDPNLIIAGQTLVVPVYAAP